MSRYPSVQALTIIEAVATLEVDARLGALQRARSWAIAGEDARWKEEDRKERERLAVYWSTLADYIDGAVLSLVYLGVR